MKDLVSYEEFARLDMRAGRVVRAEEFAGARKPACKLWIDFGELGIKKTSAQITRLYASEELPGRTVIAVVNLPPKQVADFISEVLVLGVLAGDGRVVLLEPEREVAPGSSVA